MQDKIVKQAILDSMTPEQEKAVLDSITKTVKEAKAIREQVVESSADLIVAGLKQIEAKLIEKIDQEASKIKQPLDGKDGIQGLKGEKGDRGFDGAPGRDGKDGKDGKDGNNGADGVSVVDARVDFDGSLTIVLSNGTEINAGEVVSSDAAKLIHQVSSHPSGTGSTSQVVLDAISAIQATIATYGTMALQNANSVAITGGTINGTTIGGTTPAAGTFTNITANGGVYAKPGGFTGSFADGIVADYVTGDGRISVGTADTISFYNAGVATTLMGRLSAPASSVNYPQLNAAATGKSVIFQTLGTDSAISMVLQPKGTGAIDLAAGSSGVNISNGGTVTAITFTATGSGYTSVPTATVSPPTTAGGVQATISFSMLLGATPTITSGGTGYTVGDVLTLNGGTFTTVVTLTVSTVSAGVITGITVSSYGAYTVLPASPASVTGGTGTGATFTTSWAIRTSFPTPTITNAGSGYVEQPTVSFSGGGGSGAAAYATVGGGAVIRALGTTGTQTLDFYTPSSITVSTPALRIRDGSNADSYPMAWGYLGSANIFAQGATNAIMRIGANGTGFVGFTTSGTSAVEQMRVAHTASAVNYVQVTGAATTGYSVISAQGSDTNTGLYIQAKGTTGSIRFSTNASNSNEQFRIANTTSAANYLQVTGGVTTAAPVLSAQGTDTNIDLALTPKGTGVVQFGSYTATILTPTGYITIKDSGGTTRRLLIG